MKEVGIIEIIVHGETYGRQGGPTSGNMNGFMTPRDADRVPEEALKGRLVTQCTT